MGFFGRFIYSSDAWSEEPVGANYLAIDIHDSDIAEITFRPASDLGMFYFGFQPRDYFEDPDASPAVNIDAEVASFVQWARTELEISLAPDDVKSLVAQEGAQEPVDDFVEETVQRFIELLGLPVPEALADAIP